MMARRILTTMIAVELVVIGGACLADSITFDGRTIDNVYVTEGESMYYVLSPSDGTIQNVSKTDARENCVVTTSDEDERQALFEQWKETSEKRGGQTAAAVWTPAVPQRSGKAPVREKQGGRDTGGQKARKAKTNWNRYFPMEQDCQWTYDSHVESAASRDEVRSVEVVGTKIVSGVECTVLEIRTDGAVTTRDYLQADQRGVLAYQQEMSGSTRQIVPPEYRLRFPLTAGASWEWEGHVPGVGAVTVKYEVHGRENITVPVGTFDAVKVVVTAFDSKLLRIRESMQLGAMDVDVEPVSTLTRWLAEDVGVAREMLQTKNVRVTSELRKYGKASRDVTGVSEEEKPKGDAGFTKDLPPNEDLMKLLTTPFPQDGNMLDIVQRCIEIEEAIRPESEDDFAALRLVLIVGSGQKMSLVTMGGPTDGIDPICVAAAAAMPKFGKRAIPFLINDLKSGSDTRRFWTIVALEKFGPDAAAALPLLEKALSDNNERIQRAAKSATEAIQGESK